jgi:hypothetical protein
VAKAETMTGSGNAPQVVVPGTGNTGARGKILTGITGRKESWKYF